MPGFKTRKMLQPLHLLKLSVPQYRVPGKFWIFSLKVTVPRSLFKMWFCLYFEEHYNLCGRMRMRIIEWAASAPAPLPHNACGDHNAVPTVYTAGRADAVRGYKAEAVCVSVSGWYLYGVLRVPLPRVRSVNGFPATTARPALILRINGYRTYTLFSLCLSHNPYIVA